MAENMQNIFNLVTQKLQHMSPLRDYKKFEEPKHIKMLISLFLKSILRLIHSLN